MSASTEKVPCRNPDFTKTLHFNPISYYHSILGIPKSSQFCKAQKNDTNEQCERSETQIMQESHEAAFLRKFFHLPSISTQILCGPEEKKGTFTIGRIGDIMTGFEIVEPKNVNAVSVFIGSHFIMNSTYSDWGERINFFKNGFIEMKIHCKDEDHKFPDSCEVQGIPLISLAYSPVEIQIIGSCKGILVHVLFLKKKLRTILASYPGTFDICRNDSAPHKYGQTDVLH